MKHKLLSETADWTFELIDTYHKEIERIAGDFGLDTYPVQLEIITAEQMMDAYASAGMPVGYTHWSFGKEFLRNEKRYKRGQMGLAYEIVINSDPCIAYLMEENTMTMQALVKQRAGSWDVWQTDLHNPSFAAYAELCGALGIRVEDGTELDDALDRALNHDGPALVEIMSDPELI